MAITEQTPYNSSLGNGSTTVFPYTFKIFAATDLKVYLDEVLTTSYTVSGVGSETGGNVTFSTAPASGVNVLRQRAIPYDREVDYQTSGDLLADTLDSDLDRIVCQIQQLEQRSVDSVSASVPGGSYTANDRIIADVADPVADGDAANKGYIDGVAEAFTLGAIPDGTITEDKLSLADVTTHNVSTSKHGFVPKAPNDAGQVLLGSGAWGYVAAASETAAGISPLATPAEVQAGIDPAKVVTPAGLASFGKSLTANGYQKLPGGLIIQWGALTGNSGVWQSVSFPIAFPNTCFAVVTPGLKHNTVDYVGTASSSNILISYSSSPRSYFRWVVLGGDTNWGGSYIAIGY